MVLQFKEEGIYCPAGDFYIDPWKPVERAVITHAHSDHARWGNKYYLSHTRSRALLKLRLGESISLQTLDYRQPLKIGNAWIEFFPSGHVIGSAQVAVTSGNEKWVVSGDYKLQADSTNPPFEPVPCQVFITESTFGLPIYKWASQPTLFEDINRWWASNRLNGITSVLTGYALGKMQRLISGLDFSIGPVWAHGAVYRVQECLRAAGENFPFIDRVNLDTARGAHKGDLILAPPGAVGSSWMRRFEPYSTAHASGWMAIRGIKKRKAVDTGFALSDHADWDELNWAVQATGAEKIFVTHGYTRPFVAWLRQKGKEAYELKTQFSGEEMEIDESIQEENI